MYRLGGFRKAGAALLASALVLLSACGGGNSGSGGSGSAGQAEPASGAGAEPDNAQQGGGGIVEITAWDKPAPDAPDRAAWEEAFAAFDAAYPNIKVTHEDVTQTEEKFMAAVASGEQPEVFRPTFPDMPVYISTGIVADISDLVNASPDKDRFIDGAFDMATKDGKIYAVPNDMYTTGLYYNKKLFQNAGIESPPTTWDEFVATAKTVMEHNPGVVGFEILGMEWADWHFEYYAWQAGGDLTEQQPDGTVKLTFTSEPVVTALQFYKDLKWTHQVVQNNVLQAYEDNSRDFYTGKAAMILGASDSFFGYVSQGMDPDDIGFAPYPKGPAGVGPSQVGGNMWAISPTATPEERQAAFDYIMFMMSKDVYEKRMQFNKDNGLGVNPLTVLNDVDMTQYVEGMPADFIAGIQEAAKDQQLEYFLKSLLTPYIVKPIQKVLLDPNADPLAELKAAEELAQKEVVDKYNQDVLSGAAQ